MLHETKEVRPTKVTVKNDLIKAMKNKDKVIYIHGELYKELIDDVTVSKFMKATKGFGKVSLGLTTFTALIGGPATWGALAVGAGIIGFSKYKDDFDKYKPVNNKTKNQIELYRCKGSNKFNDKNDIIIDS